MVELGTLSYGIATPLLVVVLLQQLISWRGQLDLFLLLLALVSTVVWSATGTVLWIQDQTASPLMNMLELLRDVTWFGFVFHLSSHAVGGPQKALAALRIPLFLGITGLILVTAANVLPPSVSHVFGYAGLEEIAFLILSLGILLVTLRSALSVDRATREGLALIYIGLLIAEGADILTYSAALFVEGNPYQAVRTLPYAVLALLILANSKRYQWPKTIFVSHSTAFHFVVLLGTASYLAIMGTGALYLAGHGFRYGVMLQIFIVLATVMGLVLLYSSERRRAQLRVFLNKHFYNYKYDYREEWLRFIRTLSTGGPGAHLLETVIKAIAQIVGSEGGSLWLRSEPGNFEVAASVNMDLGTVNREAGDSSLVRFLNSWQWIINLDEYEQDPELYQELVMPEWLQKRTDAWLIVPLMQDIELLGFIVVLRPLVAHKINWEDHDLLKTAGRQAATHLAQLMAVQALIEAREFQAFSRLSAFVIHDLKNLVAQLSLVVSNAAKHKNNPEFMEDAISTVDNCVSKMNRLLAQLRKGKAQPGKASELDISVILHEVIRQRSDVEPRPSLSVNDQGLKVTADRDRFSSVIEHLVQNAQEATPADGWVKVVLRRQDNHAVIEISDNGCGMDSAFIRDRLFRPFDSTKGQGGMGIGAYESREYIRELKGDICVESIPGHGSVFTIQLPPAGFRRVV